jgi:outer membrane protein OmpA-like peptidoglycan-associated protein
VAAVAPATTTSNDQLGFQPSKAPALDPSVAHFVPRSVLDQYQQTSTDASAATVPALTPPAQPQSDPGKTSSANDPSADDRARVAATTSAHAADAGQSHSDTVTPVSYSQSAPANVVFFPRDAAVLNAKAKEKVLATARSYLATAKTGYIRVVGHSSSRTADMPLARHLEVVFQYSQDFATAVAHELIRDGVPADKVLIEAVGDSQPVYLESMPQGEAGNRRAEIFL